MPPWPAGGAGLLERSLAYALGSVAAVTPALLPRPTPCGEWDLRGLLHHLNDALAALHEAAEGGRVALDPAALGAGAAADPVRTFRERAARLLGAWTGAVGDDRVVVVEDLPLAAGMVAGIGAIELAVHGWDVARACGRRRPIPDALAAALLELCPLLVPARARAPLFAARVTVAPSASPSDRLVALLGRDPVAAPVRAWE
ncbi:MAG TPA: TIGR03086 family metal-binding protein [Actinomycetes bacterium]